MTNPPSIERFGTLSDGNEVPLIRLSGNGIKAEILGLGAVIRSLDVDVGSGHSPRVLGLRTLDDYIQHSPSMGIIAGRYANRIGNARFNLDGREITLVPNEAGVTQLHGGPNGFGKRLWSIADHGASHVTLRLVSDDGDQGFPGRVEAFCRYSIAGDGLFRIELTATTDAPTVVNLAAHSYFNLDNSATILDHLVEIPADTYTPVDHLKIPTGEIAPVANTPFDFTALRPVRYSGPGAPIIYDHNYVVSMEKTAEPRLMARLIGPETKTEMQVLSTEPAVQFYDGTHLGVPVPPLNRPETKGNAGLCFEPQYFPDTPNQPQFGSATLRPGETYRQVTEYRFRAV